MFKGIITFSLMLLFCASVLECAFDTCGIKEQTQTASQFQGDCHSEQSSSKDTSQHHHCTGCSHSSFITVKAMAVPTVVSEENQFGRYSFFYKNPPLEFPKRPPVAA